MRIFIAHFVPGLALAFLGLWHMVNTVRPYFLIGPNSFTIRFWYPLITRLSRLQHLELVLILSFSIFAMSSQISDVQHLRFFGLDGIKHATIFLQLIIFTIFALFTESTRLSEYALQYYGILVASVFGQEIFLLHHHLADHIGLEGHYHWLMQLIACISFLAALHATTSPNSFPAALILSVSVIFQGCWFVNMGFVLWVPSLVPRGCFNQPMNLTGGAVVCAGREADFRARALAILQFCWIFSSISILVASICVFWQTVYIEEASS